MVGSEKDPGVIPLAISDIFAEIKSAEDHRYTVKISYFEIYNEKMFDLLSNENIDLKIYEKDGKVFTNSEQIDAHSEEEVLLIFQLGNDLKKLGETPNNNRSSRSHTIFKIIAESQNGDEIKVGMLDLVAKLAGGEKPDPSSDSFNYISTKVF